MDCARKRSKETVDRKIIISMVLVVILLIPAMALAQTNFDLRYDPQSVVAISGTVLTTIDYHPGNPVLGPKAVVVSSNNRIYTVFLGPGSYLNQIGFLPSSGSSISVTGSLRNVSGNVYLVAQSATLSSGTFNFRTSSGVPLWATGGVISPPVGTGPGGIIAPPPPTSGSVGDIPLHAARIPFNADDMSRVSGKVRDTYTIQTAEGSLPNVVAVIEDERIFGDDRFYHVVLAPQSFLMQNNIDLSHGNTLYVNGSRVSISGRNMIVATNVEEGEDFVSLRTAWGSALFAPLTPPVGAGPGQPLVQFDPNNMVNVSGKIRNLYYVTTAEDNVQSIAAIIEDEKIVGDDRFYHVLLGPMSYLTANGISLMEGNTLFVNGSKVNIGNRSMIVATDVEEGDKRVSLRTNTGVALFPAFTGPGVVVPRPPSN